MDTFVRLYKPVSRNQWKWRGKDNAERCLKGKLRGNMIREWKGEEKKIEDDSKVSSPGD